MGNPIDLKGIRFGKWIVIEKAKSPAGYEHLQYWLCRCDCGVEQIRKGAQLRWAEKKGMKQACIKCAGTKHGEFRAVEHICWRMMLDRCSRKTHPAYESYGGRGITVCERWKDYWNFLNDMGRRPGSGYSLDRIDNNKGYSPENCRWATQKSQVRNTRANKIVEFNGKSQCLAEWAEETGFSLQLIRQRIGIYGWSIEDALTIKPEAKYNWRGTKHKDSERLEHNGEKLTHSEWADRLGANRDIVRDRIRRGWSVEKAVTTPSMRPKK